MLHRAFSTKRIMAVEELRLVIVDLLLRNDEVSGTNIFQANEIFSNRMLSRQQRNQVHSARCLDRCLSCALDCTLAQEAAIATSNRELTLYSFSYSRADKHDIYAN